MRRAAQDDERRFVTLIAEVGPELLRYFERRVGADAPDLVAEVVTVGWRKHADIPIEHEHARMWFFGVARNHLRNYRRGVHRRSELGIALQAAAHLTSMVSDTAEVVAVRDLIERLDPDLAEVVTLVHWEGLSLAEIAQLQGVPAATVRGRYRRARQMLLSALAPDPS